MGNGNRNVAANQGNDQGFNTTQDNDIVTSVTGDNNTVKNWQDNSIRNYGGDQRNFTYVGGNNPATDTPVSAATMAGFYAPSDSPASQAKFTDMYQTLNFDAQKKYMNSGVAADMIAKANNLGGVDTRALDASNRKRPEISRARWMNSQLNLFGDMFKMPTPTWNSAKPQEGVEQPDFESMYDKYTSF